ncbi:hypothetical protein ACFLWE_00350 [Chloroflexota bacterium]
MITELHGYCSQCKKVWTLKEGQGVCQWCHKPATAITTTTKPRTFKSNRRCNQRQSIPESNGYDHLEGQWLTYYKVASRFAHKAKAEDTQDLLHDIILTLAVAEGNNGHHPFTEAVMYRIASHANHHYWYKHYKINNGLDCQHCSTDQRHKCRKDWLYPDCPKSIRIDRLSKPIIDSYGHMTELGELIADDKAIDLDAWGNNGTWELGYPKRLVDIAYKLKEGKALTHYERNYLWRFRKSQQKVLV